MRGRISAGWISLIFVVLFSSGTLATTGCEDDAPEEASGPSEPSGAVSEKNDEPGRDDSPSDEPMIALERPVTPRPVPLGADAASAGETPEPAPGEPSDVLALMREEISPRLGVEDERAALLKHLRTLPEMAPEPMREDWQRIVDAAPKRGPLAKTCTTCHVRHRLRLRAMLDRLPIQDSTDE